MVEPVGLGRSGEAAVAAVSPPAVEGGGGDWVLAKGFVPVRCGWSIGGVEAVVDCWEKGVAEAGDCEVNGEEVVKDWPVDCLCWLKGFLAKGFVDCWDSGEEGEN